MPVVGRQDGTRIEQPPKLSRRERNAVAASAAVTAAGEARRAERQDQRQQTSNVLNAISVFGLGKLMPLGNIGNALLREQQKQTALLEQILEAVKR